MRNPRRKGLTDFGVVLANREIECKTSELCIAGLNRRPVLEVRGQIEGADGNHPSGAELAETARPQASLQPFAQRPACQPGIGT